jgi:rhodanese-related sulfurtransferase
MNALKPDQLETFLQQAPQLVDIRPATEFAKGSLGGAVNVLLADIQNAQHNLPKDRPLLLICERGMQSELAGLYLETQGYTQVWNLAGGLRKLGMLR